MAIRSSSMAGEATNRITTCGGTMSAAICVKNVSNLPSGSAANESAAANRTVSSQ